MSKTQTQLHVLPTDKAFTDSPDVGDRACLCSRCGARIGVDEVPVRVTVNDDAEYRYCDRCTGGVLVTTVSIDVADGSDAKLTMGWG